MPKSLPSGHLYRLIYYSRNVIAQTKTNQAFEVEVGSMVTNARLRNQAEHVTGCLMCSASGFAQVLEGTRDAVERTFDRVLLDPRHTDVMMLSLTPIVRPSFPNCPLAIAWAAHAAVTDPLWHLFDQPLGAGPRTTTGGDILKLLQTTACEPMILGSEN